MRRKRIRLLLAILATLLAPTAGEGQSGAECRKRILVFLDVSGSMLPRSNSPNSPFQQSVVSLEGLLSETGFFEETDVVEVVLFGDRAREKQRAQGREEVAQLVSRLKANKEEDLVTDFRLFFDALAKALEDSSSFNSQVVLLGSDLVHERINRRPAAEDLADWNAVLAEKAAVRQQINANSTKTAYVLFVPPPLLGLAPVQARVRQDLINEFERIEVTSPSSASGDLPRKLRLGLLAAPEVMMSRSERGSDQLAWIVRNPNCAPVRLKTATARRIGKGFESSEPVSFRLEGEEVTLGGTRTPEARRKIVRPLPSGPDWESPGDIAGTVETEEGVIGKSEEGTTGSWLLFRPIRGVYERGLLRGPALRLDIELRGLTVEARSYRLALREVSGGGGAQILAQANFSAPIDVTPEERRLFRLILPANSGLPDSVEKKLALKVEVEPGRAEGDGGIPIAEDPAATRANYWVLWTGLGALLLTLVSPLAIAAVVRQFPVLQGDIRSHIPWLLPLGLSLLALTTNLFHLNLLQTLSPTHVDWISTGLAALALLVAVIFVLKRFQAARFAVQVLNEKKPLPLPRYLRKSRVNAWLPWVLGATATLAFILAVFARPSVSEKLGRDSDPPRLRVVSDE